MKVSLVRELEILIGEFPVKILNPIDILKDEIA